jgi:fructokinase
VGSDNYGREIIRRFESMGLPSEEVQVDDSAPTGTAKVDVSANGLAQFTIQDNVAWDWIAPTAEAIAQAKSANAICFGSLAQRAATSRSTIQQLVAMTSPDALRVFDVNFRQHFYTRGVIEDSLGLASVLKLNEDELPTLGQMLNLSGGIESKVDQLAQMFNLQLIALTCGARGSLLYQRSGNRSTRWSKCQPARVNVVDTVGAGDSFTAALVLGLLRKMDLNEVHQIANDVAGYVCSQSGATPPMPVEFKRRLRSEDEQA